MLDRVPNPHPDTNYVARFTFPEFTVMCPVTGQPDFATLVIDYVPNGLARGIEIAEALSRTASAIMARSTRNARSRSARSWSALLKPKWLRIGGYFHPRGGMPIDVFWQAGKLPAGVWVPDQGVATYRARG